MNDFGANLRRLREEDGCTVAALASRLGVAPATLTGWEQGKVRHPRPQTLRKLAAASGVTEDQLTESPDGNCGVWIVGRAQVCRTSPAVPFSARCSHGHPMAGLACETCLASAKPGCLECWQQDHHACDVTFLAAVSA